MEMQRMPFNGGVPIIGTDVKLCVRCGERPEHVSRNGQHRSWCSSCLNKANYETKAKDPERYLAIRRNRHLRIKYGLSAKDFDDLVAAQDNSCAICHGDWSDRGPHVDHDHETGEIRGLLCHWCNLMLGNAKDDPERLRAAIQYLETRRTEFPNVRSRTSTISSN